MRSIRYAALLSTPVPTRAVLGDSPAWHYWYGAAMSASARGQLYQVIKGTIALRNQLP